MSVSLANPLWLLVALLAVPLAVVGLRWMVAMSRVRRWSAVALRAALLAVMALALAGASSLRTSDRLAVIAVVDVSQSVRDLAFADSPGAYAATVRNWLARASAERRPDDLFGVVVFDGRRAALLAPAARDTGDLDLSISFREGTDIEGALRHAAALFPPGVSRRLLLVSDGVETSGDALAAAADLASGASAPRTPVDVLPIAYAATNEVFVEAVDTPPTASSESLVTVRVVLRATGRARGALRLLAEGAPVPDETGATVRQVEFGPGRAVELFQVRLADRRVHRFEAVFEPEQRADGTPAGDRVASNNRASAFTISPGRGSILLIDGVSEGAPQGAGRTLVSALRATGLDVEVVAPLEAPADLLTLQNYDLVALEDVAADEVSPTTQQLLADYVSRSGGGLVMIGGPDSFGAGGWKGSPLEPLLPVTLDLPEQLIVPPAAIMIVLDSSGSMARGLLGGMRTQQAIANEGAARAILSLDEQDLVGVLEFNNATNTVVALGPNTDPQASAERVRRIVSGGGTNMHPALAEAGERLAQVEAQVKHVILLSDGIAQGAPSAGVQIASNLRTQGITVSTIAVGDGADTDSLQRIAREGGGTFYRVIDPNTLPRIFLRETRVVRRPLIREGEFTPVAQPVGSPITAGLPARTPPLFGYVLTQKRPDPSVVYPLDAPSGEPILAHWNAGLGRVAAFTSDAHDKWARAWVGWPGFAQLWTQLARTIARPPASRGFDLAADVTGDTLSLRLDARDEENLPIDLLTVPGVVYGPDGSRVDVSLTQTGPGLYEARVPAPESGAYIVALTPRQGDRALAPVLGGATRAVGPELRTLRSNVGLLREIADRTGGRVLDLSDPLATPLFARENLPASRASLPLWRPLLIVLVVVFLLDVATRRVAWDRWLTRDSLAELREAAAAARSARAATATSTLRRAKERAGASQPDAPKLERQAPDPAAEAERRRAIRRAIQAQRAAASAPPASSPQPKSVQSGDSEATSGLLAAKKRARDRMAGADDD